MTENESVNVANKQDRISADENCSRLLPGLIYGKQLNFGGRKYLIASTQEQKQNCTEYKDIYIEEHLKAIFYFCRYLETLEALFDTILHIFAANVQYHYSC